MKPTANLATVFFLLAGMALFGSATPVSKLVGEAFPVFAASLLRVLLGALTLLPFVYSDIGRQVKELSSQDWLYIGLISLFGMVGFTSFLLLGMRYVSGVAGSLIMSFTPALTAAAAHVFMGAPLGARRLAAIAAGVAGIVVLSLFKGQFGGEASGFRFYLGALLVLLAICCEASYTLFGKQVTQDCPPLTTSFLACVMSIPLFLLLTLLQVDGLSLSGVSGGAWAALLWWGIGTLGAGSALWFTGVSRAKGTTAAGFMSVMPVSALLLSYFLLGEAFHPVHLAGIALVFASIALMSWVHMSGDEDR